MHNGSCHVDHRSQCADGGRERRSEALEEALDAGGQKEGLTDLVLGAWPQAQGRGAEPQRVSLRLIARVFFRMAAMLLSELPAKLISSTTYCPLF